MSGISTEDATHARSRGSLAPAQWYAVLTGSSLVVLGGLAVILEDVSYGAVGALVDQPDLLIWAVSGWTAVFWTTMGAIGLLSAARLGSARSYAGAAGIIFAVVAVWGFVDGNDVMNLLAADTTNNLMHAALAVVGLLVAAIPPPADRPDHAANAGFGAADADLGVVATRSSRARRRTRRSRHRLG